LRLLLDTHIAFWLIADVSKLRSREYALLRDAETDIALSVVAVWELRLKWNSLGRSGDRKGPKDPLEALSAFQRLKIPILALEPEIAAAPLQEPMVHKDPFDELLLVQAQELGLLLMTRDKKLKGHPLAYFA
jgi:PIN domain nuclease of toxin-antitoxin system